MGLLSDTSGRGKVIRAIQNHGSKLSVVAFVSGIIWMALLANQEFNGRNYFSENQLLPGMVETYFSNTHQFYKLLRDFQKHCKDDEYNTKTHRHVIEEFNKLNLDVFTQNFHVLSKGINGTNVFGIYRAPRASGVESIVLNIPNHGGCQSVTGIALMLSLAKFFRMQTYWAKDIIFLLTEHQLYGMKAWLSGYFEDKSTTDIIFDHLEGHGGSIQAALTLDLESESISYMDVSIHGMNGMLPNLDLVHVLVRIANYESVPVKLDFQNALYIPPHDFHRSLETLVRTMSWQSNGIPTGNHGLFYKYRIEAYTLKGISSNPRVRNGHPIDFESLGRYVEGVFRSINNLLEHVHQSFFMYLLPNTNRYISIGLYMPPLACLVVPLLVALLQTWIQLFSLDQEQEQRNLVPLSILANFDVLRRIIISFMLGVVSCYVYKNKAAYIPKLSEGYNEDWFLFASLVTNCLLGAVLTRIVCGRLIDRQSILVLNLYMVIHLTTTITLISIFNFSAAYFIAAMFVPAIVLSGKIDKNWVLKLLGLFCMVTSIPPIYLFVTNLLSHIPFDGTYFDIEELLLTTLQTWRKQMNSIEELKAIGLWTSDILFNALLPLWILSASILL